MLEHRSRRRHRHKRTTNSILRLEVRNDGMQEQNLTRTQMHNKFYTTDTNAQQILY